MARKIKLFSKLFTRKDNEEHKSDNSAIGDTNSEQSRSIIESELKGTEAPQDSCHFCYEKFNTGEMGYQCTNCEVFYHYPDCIKNQTNCRACGEKIILLGNVYKFLKLRSVICPNCGMKVKLFFDSTPKLHINCPNCGHEGHLPNPYLKELQPPKIQKIEDDEDIVDNEGVTGEGQIVEGAGDIDSTLEPEISIDDNIQDLDEDSDHWDDVAEGFEELDNVDSELLEKQEILDGQSTDLVSQIEDGPKIIKPDKRKKRKPKLVILDQSVTCNICTKQINTGSPVLVCRCGKKYHETCASEIGDCPTCDCDLNDFQSLIEASEPGLEQNMLSEYGSDQSIGQGIINEGIEQDQTEPGLELGTELDTTLTFENLELGYQSKIFKSIGQGIAKAPGLEFKLVYIYGDNNEILTHFLQAIGNYILYSETELRVRYTTMEKLLKEFDQAKELDRLDLFDEFYAGADILLLDNFQNISGKKPENEAFFKIFDQLLDQGKQLVIAGNSIIDEIKGLDNKSAKRVINLTGLTINLS